MNEQVRGLLLVGTTLLAGCSADNVAATPEPPSHRLVAEQREAARRLLADPPKVAAPLFYIDGGPYVRGKDDNGGEFSVIDPSPIATVQILDGAEAEARAGRPVPEGLIWITTRDAAATH